MLVVPNASLLMKVAVIDPGLEYGQPGQYVSFEGSEALRKASLGQLDRKEVRYYYKNLATSSGEPIPSQLIITHIPPGHVQPFHTHESLHEHTIVAEGNIIAIDSETLLEKDVEEIRRLGTLLGVLDMVVEDPGVRHTIMNPNQCRAVTYTIQTARIPLAEFPHDWVRDKRASTDAAEKAA